MPDRLRILIADDNEDDALLIVRRIRRETGWRIDFDRVDTAAAMAAAMADGDWDLVISDVNMPGFGAEGALRLYRETGAECPFIVVSGMIGEEAAVSLLKAGAHDFVLKSNLARLVPAIERELHDWEVRRDKRVAQEQLRRANAELENALAAKTRFLAAASHDLRQPVQALFCFTAVLQAQLQCGPARATADELVGALEGLKLLLDSLLDVSKLDAGIITPEPAAFRAGAVMEQVVAQMSPLAAEKGLSLRLVGCDAPVESDPTLLARVLRNLVENAIRYTESGTVLLGCRRRRGQVCFEVWDTGIGIGEELREKIFEEFFQAGNPERDRRKGLGLGLAIVQRLAHLLGHEVTVRSAPGRGSVFSVAVPLARGGEPPPPTIPVEEMLRGSGRVLIIDDEAAVAKATAALVTTLGFDAMAVESADEALAEMARQGCTPTAIIADYRLAGGRTGLEAISRICSECSLKIPSLLLTGDTAPDRLREARAAGVPTLHKPVRPGELIRMLNELTQSSMCPS